MGLLNFIFGVSEQAPKAAALGDMQSPAFYEFVRFGDTETSVQSALKNDAVLRACDLVAGSIAMLPLEMKRRNSSGIVEQAEDHPLYNLLRYQPNPFQTAHEFKQLMQGWLLLHGNAYARIARSLGRITALVPIDPQKVSVETDGGMFPVRYRVVSSRNEAIVLMPQDMFHLRGFSIEASEGVSRIQKAGDIIQTATQQQMAANSLYKNGVISGVALKHPSKLTPEAARRLRDTYESGFSGPANAGKVMVLEEGMEREFPPATAENAQLVQSRAQLTEAIGRVFGVPRPLMFMDDTSWGSGIEQLAMLFVRFGLAPWFSIWEQAITRSLVPLAERGTVFPDFDERELLRGTLNDQGQFLARALGAGGHRPWMTPNEAREHVGMSVHPDGDGLLDNRVVSANVATATEG